MARRKKHTLDLTEPSPKKNNGLDLDALEKAGEMHSLIIRFSNVSIDRVWSI